MKSVKSNKKPMDKKKRGLIIGVVSACLAFCITLAVVLIVVLRGPDYKPFQIPSLELPIEERYALQKYSYEDLSNSAMTLRADVMNVTERNLKRPETQLLEDEFSLTYDTTKRELNTVYGPLNVSSSNTLKIATINFTDYPSPSHGVSSAYTNGKSGDMTMTSGDFYKYMLMSQGQHLTAEAEIRSRNGTLTQGWLKKHKAADAQYGKVTEGDNAVTKEITLDPIYRSFHATGLYLPAGEVVKVQVEGLAPGERIAITINVNNSLAWRGGVDEDVYNETVGTDAVTIQSKDAYFTKADILTASGKFVEGSITNQSQWARQNGRMPWLTADFIFDHNGEYNIGTHFGGIMHIDPKNCYSRVKTTISGAVETPHYILGVTTPEYFDKYLRTAPGVIGVLDTENGQLVGPTGTADSSLYMRRIKKEEVDQLASLWHSFFSVNESFTGGSYNRNNIVKFDWHVPAGAAVALGGYVYACPTGWFDSAMNYSGLLASGTWGILHEIGHNHGSAYGTVWGFGGSQEGEVRNNALTLLGYIMFCDVGTTVRDGGRAEHGGYANPYSTLSETINNKSATFDFNSFGYFQALGMYANIMHSFGAEKFYELLYSYKADPAFVPNGTRENIRADFNYRCARIYGMNFTKYFNTFYNAGINNNVYTEEQLAYMNSLPSYEPVANFYAGGIDGVKTAGDYNVTFGQDIVFDLQGRTISTLDSGDKKGFEVVAVSNPEHGSIKNLGGGKYAYSFNKDYAGALDEFSFKVKLSDGVVHEFTIYLRIAYNGARITTYDQFDAMSGGLANNWDNIAEKISTLPKKVENNAYSYIPQYRSDKWQAKVLEYYWQAPKTGDVTFHLKRDDGIEFFFGNDFDSLESQEILTGDSSEWTDKNGEGKKHHVEKGEYYAIRLLNVNMGGPGSASIGYKYEGQEITQIPTNEIFHPNYPIGKDFETYVFTPQFLVSKKDKINLSSVGTDKSTWEIISAPDDELIHQGRYDQIQRARFDEDGNLLKNPDGSIIYDTIRVDKWTYLIDGDVGTIMHTAYGNSSIKYPTDAEPYEYVIDTGKVQPFNYFTVTTRTGALNVSKITKYELQISSDGKNYATVAKGEQLEYTQNVATVKFDSVSGRFWKLRVKGTTGNSGQFVVIAELDAGITSATQKIIPATSSLLYATKGWVNTASVDEEQSGYLMSTSNNQKLVFKFAGTSLAVYAAVGEGYGSADVYLDGQRLQTIDLNQKTYDARKLVCNAEKLENKEHTLEIITKSSEKVMINLFGIPYSASLLNASNIYLERALTISLIVFVVLFAAALALLLCLLFIPKFRKFMGNNKAIDSLDKYLEKQKEKRRANRLKKKEEKKAAKQKELAAQGNKKETKQAGKTSSQQKASAKTSSTAKAKPASKSTAKNGTAIKKQTKTQTKVVKKK